jgi:hypothetical protein
MICECPNCGEQFHVEKGKPECVIACPCGEEFDDLMFLVDDDDPALADLRKIQDK